MKTTFEEDDEIPDEAVASVEENKRAFECWLEGRPAVIQEIGREYPGWQCYHTADRPDGHYRIYAYTERGTLELQHGRDSFLPGITVFGVSPDELVVCGCGKWLPPTAAQQEATIARIERFREAHLAAPCDDPDCRLHEGARQEAERNKRN